MKEIECNRLVITDAEGNPKCVIDGSLGKGTIQLHMQGQNGPRIIIGIDSGDYPYISLRREDGTMALGIGMNNAQGIGIAIYDVNGEVSKLIASPL
jgi:hypothetical protein